MEPSPAQAAEASLDHPIFRESIRLIREALEPTGLYARWPDALERDVLERLVHSSGDLTLPADLVITPGACLAGMVALAAGAPILTDTAMAAAAVAPMARRTFNNPVHNVLRWAPEQAPPGGTRAAAAAIAVSVRIGAPAARATIPARQAPGVITRSAGKVKSPLLCTKRSSTSRSSASGQRA